MVLIGLGLLSRGLSRLSDTSQHRQLTRASHVSTTGAVINHEYRRDLQGNTISGFHSQTSISLRSRASNCLQMVLLRLLRRPDVGRWVRWEGRFCCINCSEVAWPWGPVEVNRGASRETIIDAIRQECVESQEVIALTPKTQRDGSLPLLDDVLQQWMHQPIQTKWSEKFQGWFSQCGAPVHPRRADPGQDTSTPRALHAQHLHLRHIIIARPTVPAETRDSRGSNGKIDKVCKFGTGDAQEERMTTML